MGDDVTEWISQLSMNPRVSPQLVGDSMASANAVSAARGHEPPTRTNKLTNGDKHSLIEHTVPSKLEQSFFMPQLWLARRTRCVELLRAHGVRSVADLGCGHGAIISLLTIPSDYIDDFPSIYPPSEVLPSSPSSPSVTAPTAVHRSSKLDTLRQIPRKPLTEQQLHLTRLVGVDLDKASLKQAVEVTAPPPSSSSSSSEVGTLPSFKDKERWEELSVELYEGGVEVYSPALERIEAMIASEVIEHMTPGAFKKFGSTVLGLYGPRLVIVTTPNHEFNPYFVSSSSEDEEANRFPDPTGRTKRVFRDEDHRFEMTRAEFEEWAKRQADEWDYEVTFTGVGSLANYFGTRDRSMIPFPPPSLRSHPELAQAPASLAVPTDPSTFFATQIAIFTKIIPNEAERSPRSHKPTPLPFFYSPITSNNLPLPGTPPTPTSVVSVDDSSHADAGGRPKMYTRKTTSPTPHHLVHTHLHTSHPSASVPAPPQIILREVRRILRHHSPTDERESDQDKSIVLHRLWHQFDHVRELCGGMVGSLVDALVEDDREMEFEFELIDGECGDEALRIIWKGGGEQGEETLTASGLATPDVEYDRHGDDEDDNMNGYDEVDQVVGGWDDEHDDDWPAHSSPPARNPLINGNGNDNAPHTYAGAW
ncbi:hypothetical protein ACM66B_006646 [Microbotryomycetes sp. NB124-2]